MPAKLTTGELPSSPLDAVVQEGSHTGAKVFVQYVQVLLGQARAHLEKACEYHKWYYDH